MSDTEYYHYTDTEYYHYTDCDCDICLEARDSYSNFTNLGVSEFTYDKYAEYITDMMYKEYVKYLEKYDFITFEEFYKQNERSI